VTSNSQPAPKITPRAILGFVVYLFINPLILFITAGSLQWGMAWIYFGVSIFAALFGRILAHRKNPGLLTERGRYQQAEGVKPWDRVLVPLVALYGPLATIVIAGLDWRFKWTHWFPLWVQVTALLVGVLGLVLASWAMVENRFFSAVVRIQEDRGHSVCQTGPYRWIRHPGYAGGILWYLITPFVFNAAWSFIPALISVIFTVVRTALEDQTLQVELPGYQAYTRQTRFRLLPGIW
jgi:protein-S-isoprenylcysteine O-methyltransferase Ste14